MLPNPVACPGDCHSEPPAAPEAEGALLGAVLQLSTDDAATALAEIVEDDFTVPAHLLTFHAVTVLLDCGEQPEPLSVLSQLRRMGRVSSWPTPSASVGVFLAQLVEAIPIPLGYAVARQAVLEAAARRQLHLACVRLAQAAGGSPFDGLPRLLHTELQAVLTVHERLTSPGNAEPVAA